MLLDFTDQRRDAVNFFNPSTVSHYNLLIVSRSKVRVTLLCANIQSHCSLQDAESNPKAETRTNTSALNGQSSRRFSLNSFVHFSAHKLLNRTTHTPASHPCTCTSIRRVHKLSNMLIFIAKLNV